MNTAASQKLIRLMRRQTGWLAVLALAAAAGSAQAAQTPAQIYGAYCTDCHGAKLEGAQAPPLINPRWLQDGGAQELRARIHDGVPSKGMPPWGGILAAADIDALVAFVQTQTTEAASQGGASDTGPKTFKTDQYTLRVESVLESGLDQPKSMAVLDAEHLLVTDSQGLRVIDKGSLVAAPISGLPTLDTLEEVAFHRATTRGTSQDWLYITYVCSKACGHPDRHAYALARGRIEDGKWVDHQKLLDFGDGDHVYGVSKLAFDDAGGYVYFTLSGADHPGQDPADFEKEIVKAQDLGSHRGKTFRIHDDGRVPTDNPFVGKPGALPILWSYGHRGLSGLYFDNVSRSLWATEHGPWGGDELNRIVRGGNYGWPKVSFGYHYAGKPIGVSQAPGVEAPIFHWTPSVGASTVVVYEGAAFPKWQGNVLVGSLGARIGHTLYRFQLAEGRALLYKYPSDTQGHVLRDDKGVALPRVPRYEEIAPDIGRIRDTRIGPDGFIYLLLEHPDRIVRLVPQT